MCTNCYICGNIDEQSHKLIINKVERQSELGSILSAQLWSFVVGGSNSLFPIYCTKKIINKDEHVVIWIIIILLFKK